MSNLVPPLEFSDGIKKTHSYNLTRNINALVWSAKVVTQSKTTSWVTMNYLNHSEVEDEL